MPRKFVPAQKKRKSPIQGRSNRLGDTAQSAARKASAANQDKSPPTLHMSIADKRINHINQSTSLKVSLKTTDGNVLQEVRYEQIDAHAHGQRLDNYLITRLKGVPKTFIYRIIRNGEVRVNKKRAQAQTRLEQGDNVRIPPVRTTQKNLSMLAPAREFPVLYEDGALLVINKPSGVAVHGGSGVNFGIIEQVRQARPQSHFLELVHRLDRDTSGILVLAKKRSALTSLQEQFRQRETGKTYLALVHGRWQDKYPQPYTPIRVPLHKYLTPQGERRVRVTTADDPLGKHAHSIVHPIKQLKLATLVAVTIKTGRTHQIRVHLAHAGFPIIGDDKYGNFECNKEWATHYHFGRMFLHAYQLAFEHPLTNEPLQMCAALPEECQQLLKVLENESD